MRIALLAAIATFVYATTTLAADGVVSVKSTHSAEVTANRFTALIEKKGLTVFARINHAVGAESVALSLRPTEVIIFGNPKVGTPLMQCAQTVGIDLPQKMLVWEDEAGDVWLSYNNPEYVQRRHGVEGCDAVIEKISQVLGKLASAAASE